MHLKPIRPYRCFPFEHYQCELWRVEDETYQTLSERSFEIRVSSWSTKLPERLSLPRALVALETLLGKSSAPFHPLKQTFSFPFLLRVTRSSESFHYLFKVMDEQGNVAFELHRLVDQLKYLTVLLPSSNPPIEEEFSQSDIEHFIQHLWRYLNRITDMLWEVYQEFDSFVRWIDLEQILYGFWEGQFFEKRYKDEREYREEKRRRQRQYGDQPMPPFHRFKERAAFVQAITG